MKNKRISKTIRWTSVAARLGGGGGQYITASQSPTLTHAPLVKTSAHNLRKVEQKHVPDFVHRVAFSSVKSIGLSVPLYKKEK